MRAEQPVEQGFVDREWIRIAYEIYGSTGPTLVMLPCWIIVHNRSWKAQIAHLAKDCRIVVIDGRGNGKSDRPVGWEHFTYDATVGDALAVIDRLGVEDCVLFGYSRGGPQAALIAAQMRPGLVKAIVLIAPVGPASEEDSAKRAAFCAPPEHKRDWYNAHFIREDYPGFLRTFFKAVFVEPHSTQQIEDAVGWGMETNPAVLIHSSLGAFAGDVDLAAAYAAIACPTPSSMAART